LIAAAAAYLLYFGLLLYCDLRRPQDPGLVVAAGDAGLVASSVSPGSLAAAAGLRAGDTIATIDGRPMRGRLDWFAFTAQVRPGVPIRIDVSAPDRRTVSLLPLASQPRHWRRREGLGLAAARLTQLVSLSLALLVAFRRPHDPRARLGAWLLASVAVFCIVPPWGQAAVWRALPAPVGWLLWGPHVSALALGAIIATFFARFRPDTTPLQRVRLGAVVWAPTIVALVWHVRFAWLTVYSPALGVDWSPWGAALPALTPIHAIGGVLLLLWTYGRVTDLTERRRIAVLVAGTIVGVTAALCVVSVYWARPDDEVAISPFASTALFAGTLISLAFPASLGYAILRHRLLDVSLIVRQGLRYALARRALLSMAPALAFLVAIDLLTHADQPVSAILAARGWIYGLLAGAVGLARLRRDRWLDALDRRFFRDRYHAQRILREVLASVRDAGRLEPAAPRILESVGRALHPVRTALVSRPPKGGTPAVLAATPELSAAPNLPPDGCLLDLAAALGRPLDVAPEHASRVLAQLPPNERQLVADGSIEVIVPLPEGTFLLLGTKRSEEPYSADDLDFLATMAESLRIAEPVHLDVPVPPLAEPRPFVHHDPSALAECPECGRCEGAAVPTCPDDGTPLTVVPIPRRLDGRYGIERRLGRGGMGVVYLAHDTTLDRRVAIKVIRADAGDPAAARRFDREARAAARLAHPHVVTVHDVGRLPGGPPFLVMEYVPGPTLRELLNRKGPLPAREVVRLLAGPAQALDAAHAAGLVHRDLKPENLIVGPDRRVKIADFGLARAIEAEAETGGPRLTREGGVPGTPEYMAPEQIRQEPPSPAWDRWALGVVAYELLTGRLPFSAEVGDGRAGLPAFEQEADRRMRDLVSRVLAMDPAQRPASAVALVKLVAERLGVHDDLATV
jgi:predicted Ser/Thr protein kinase